MNAEVFSARATRRDFLRTFTPAVAALLGMPVHAGEEAKPAGQPFSFFEINDLHYLTDDCGRWFRVVVEQMKASAPGAKFCLICGDLADTGAESAITAVKEIFGGLGIPLHPVPGNHDYTPQESRAGYDAVFPERLNYRFDYEGWQFLGLDTTMGTKYDKTTIGEATLAWLDAEIPKLDPQKPTVTFTHFPLAEKVAMTPLNAPALIERLLKLNLVSVLSGHWHGASERVAGHATLITSRCSSRVRNNADRSPRKGWYVCEATPDGTLTRHFVDFKAPADIPTDDTSARPKK